ncbi:hypothetical protein ABPG74_002662 [Tetrahymena malaccensis]
MIKKLLILSLTVAIILAAAGSDVQCNTSDQTQCGGAGGSSWAAGAGTKSKISECNNVGTLSGKTDVYDTLCSSCYNDKPYAQSGNNGCQASVATAGTTVQCQKSGSCSSCGNISPAFGWSIPSGDTSNCIITSCLAAPMPTTGLIDNFCKSCGGSSKVYANSDGSACVASSATCQSSRTSGWTDSDCNICNKNTGTPTLVYAKADQSGCQATVGQQGANVPCQGSSNSCSNCGTFTNFLFVASGSDTQNCYVKSCLAAPMPASGLNDYFCGSCNKNNKFVNAYGTTCVNSTGSCTRNSGWTDSDCQVCNASGANSANQYAAADQKSCVSTKPQSSSSSIIAFSSIIVASLIL